MKKFDEGKYAATIESGERSPRTFLKKSVAEQIIDKSSIAQSFNTEIFLSQTIDRDTPRLEH